MSIDWIDNLNYEPFEISHLVDDTGHYRLDLDPEFPFCIKLFSYHERQETSVNWHTRLELFIPTAGHGKFRMGNAVIDFREGDVLVVDNLKLHGLTEFHGSKRHAVVISFMPDLFYTVGSPLCNFSFLTPFYYQDEGGPLTLKATDSTSELVHGSLSKLLSCYFSSSNDPYFMAGCKTYLSEVLYHLARKIGWSDRSRAENEIRMQTSRRLGELIKFLDQSYADKITVARAASMLGMSESRFMRFFKDATGMTFITYLTKVRLTAAYRLLKQEDRSIADIATMVGFTDQSYFDKQFKRHFRMTPRQFREKA
jgi:AraC-like DNA-binding protein/mannose-6-phosphate isomerase-like protein (cupin superfamily)